MVSEGIQGTLSSPQEWQLLPEPVDMRCDHVLAHWWRCLESLLCLQVIIKTERFDGNSFHWEQLWLDHHPQPVALDHTQSLGEKHASLSSKILTACFMEPHHHFFWLYLYSSLQWNGDFFFIIFFFAISITPWATSFAMLWPPFGADFPPLDTYILLLKYVGITDNSMLSQRTDTELDLRSSYPLISSFSSFFFF